MRRLVATVLFVLALFSHGSAQTVTSINLSQDLVSLGIAGSNMLPNRADIDARPLWTAAMTYVAEGIRVNSVHPGFIDTPLTQAQARELNESVIAATPMKRGGKPIEIAYGCLYLASDESSYVTGIELVIDGGYLAQ